MEIELISMAIGMLIGGVIGGMAVGILSVYRTKGTT